MERQQCNKQIRQVLHIDPSSSEFFSKEIMVRHVIPARAHVPVSEESMFDAADRMGRLLANLPKIVMDSLADRGVAFHVIGMNQAISDLPEHCHRKRDKKFNQCRGLSGVQSSCGEENLLDIDTDPRHNTRDIVAHEFVHTIMGIGLTLILQEEIQNDHTLEIQSVLWMKGDGKSLAYAVTNAREYFAELSTWYFGSHGQFADRIKRIPTRGPGGLIFYDTDGFNLLPQIYGGNHPLLNEKNGS